jgi:hypothetical protein
MINEDLMVDVRTHHDDALWVDDNAHDLYLTLKHIIKDRKRVSEVIHVLLLIYPTLLNRDDLRKWAKLTYRVHRKVNNIKKKQEEYKPLLVPSIQDVYVVTPVAATRAKPRKHRSERINQRELLEVYLELLAQLVYREAPDSASKMIISAMKFVRIVNDQYYYNKFYQTLAFIHVANARFDKAVDIGNLAYKYWKDHDDVVEAGLTAFALAMAYRGMRNWEESSSWLDVASDVFASIDYPKQFGLISLERSCNYLYLNKYDMARQWATDALNEFAAEGRPHHVALADHTVGLAFAYSDQYDEAFLHLYSARDYWEETDNLYQSIHINHTIAFTEARRGKSTNALKLLYRTKEMCDTIPDSRQRKYQLRKMDFLITKIESGEDIKEVSPDKF